MILDNTRSKVLKYAPMIPKFQSISLCGDQITVISDFDIDYYVQWLWLEVKI